MTFTVTYRGADGALREEAVEAAGRSECFAQMKARGIVPVSVKEGTRKDRGKNAVSLDGWVGRNELRPSGSSGGKPQSSIRKLKSAIFLAAAVLAVVGGACWWFAFATREDTPRPITLVPKREMPTKQQSAKREKPHGSASVATNGSTRKGAGSGITSGEKADRVDMEAGAESKDAEPPRHAVRQHVSNNPADQILGMALSTPFGQAIPPIPYYKGLDEDFKRALETPIEDLETDDEQTRALKNIIRQAHIEMKEYIDRGMTVQEVLEEYRKIHAENLEVRAGIMREARTIFDSGDIEGAKEYVRKINLALDQMNIPRIEMPRTPEEGRRLRAERGREALARRAQKDAAQ